MQLLLIVALVVLPQVVPGTNAPVRYRGWQWQRAIQPAPGAPADEQCVVLDADLYAAAAPGLRDVRLLQDKREIAYALQESYDEPALQSTRGADRSLYTTVLKVPLSNVGSLQQGTAVLPQHVPVERIELVSRLPKSVSGPSEGHSRAGAVHIRMVVTPVAGPDLQNAAGELIEDDLNATNPVELTAIGANLQHSARFDLAVGPGTQRYTEALLQMHQRSLCYQPLSSAPLLLLYGNAEASPVRYAYAAHYQPRAGMLLAYLGAAQGNGSYQPRAGKEFTVTRRQRLAFAVCAAIAVFLLVAVPVLRSR